MLKTASLYAAVDSADETELMQTQSGWTPRISAEKIVLASLFVDAHTCASLSPVPQDSLAYPNGAIMNMACSACGGGGNIGGSSGGSASSAVLSPGAGTASMHGAAYMTGGGSALGELTCMCACLCRSYVCVHVCMHAFFMCRFRVAYSSNHLPVHSLYVRLYTYIYIMYIYIYIYAICIYM